MRRKYYRRKIRATFETKNKPIRVLISANIEPWSKMTKSKLIEEMVNKFRL
jgi:hypothetical protein